jgi:hypothetical protein
MKNKFVHIVILTLLITVNTLSCGNDTKSPKEVLSYIITQISKNNLEEAFRHVTPDLYNLMQNLRTDIGVEVYSSKKNKKITETINGDLAYVSVFFKNENTPLIFYFKRIDGEWKIDVPFKKDDISIDISDIIPYIEDGDFILSSENHLSSYYIRSLCATDKRFSHSGIIYKKDGIISVIGSEGLEVKNKNIRFGVMKISLEEYLEDKNNIGIYRAKSKKRNAYSAKALEYLGIPFDYKYTLDNENELYCTQLIQVVLRETNSHICLIPTYVQKEKKEIILPDAISASENFMEIKYVEKKNFIKNE